MHRYIIIPRCSDITGQIRSRLDGSRTKAISCCATRCEWNSIELMLLYHTIPWCNQQNGAIEGRRRQKNQWGLPTNPLCTRLAKVIICGPQITKANRQTKPKRGSQTAISVCVFMADVWRGTLMGTRVSCCAGDAGSFAVGPWETSARFSPERHLPTVLGYWANEQISWKQLKSRENYLK